MKTIKLNLSERVFAIDLLNQYKGDHETLAFVLNDIKEFAITDEEWEKGERIIKNKLDKEGKIESSDWSWDDAKGGEKEIKVSDKVVEYLIKKIDEKDKGEGFSIIKTIDRAVISLVKKLSK